MSETENSEIKVAEPMADDKNKFRMLDILVTLIILASVTAVISPRFSVASSEARLTEMVSSLQKVRSQIQIYTIQHNGLLPGQRIHGENVKQARFIKDLSRNNPETGRPYLEEMPENPFNKLNTVTCVNVKDLLPDGTEGTGWWFNVANGRFHACDGAFHAQY
jgi:type II secretory pathway pseudopilin PulG